MDYAEQQKFLNYSRLWAAAVVLAIFACATACFRLTSGSTSRGVIVFALVTIALAIFLYYTPDYLHLTVNPEKRALWAIKVRWRIVGAALVIGLLAGPDMWSRIAALFAAVWLLAFNRLARIAPKSYVPLWLWAGDLMICTFLLVGGLNLALGALLLAAAACFAIVALDEIAISEIGPITICSLALIVIAARQRHSSFMESALCAALLLAAVAGAVWLVYRAKRQNARNIAAAIVELRNFSGYSEEKIKHLWMTSNQQLARNWQAAAPEENDAEQLAEWYRENSELYLFAISGYNLEYKRIRSNLNVLKFARGACLDYGAGNGEIVLELARRGHIAAYCDVPGETIRFARWRSEQRKLALKFFRSKEELAGAAKVQAFDTIYSLDVLEHLPDLPGELEFLSSLLNSGGRMVFDVPAGATKSHPMHLNHNLDVAAFLKAKGLKDERTLWQRLPFRKEEKYIFRAR